MDRWMRPFLLIISGLSHLQSSVNMMKPSWSFISSVLSRLDSRLLSQLGRKCLILRVLQVCEVVWGFFLLLLF